MADPELISLIVRAQPYALRKTPSGPGGYIQAFELWWSLKALYETRCVTVVCNVACDMFSLL